MDWCDHFLKHDCRAYGIDGLCQPLRAICEYEKNEEAGTKKEMREIEAIEKEFPYSFYTPNKILGEVYGRRVIPQKALWALETRATAYRQKESSLIYCSEKLNEKIREVDRVIEELKVAFQKPSSATIAAPSPQPETPPPPQTETPEPAPDAQPPKAGIQSKKNKMTSENAIDFLMRKQLIALKCPTANGVAVIEKWDGITYIPKRNGKKQAICRELYKEFPDWTFCKEFIERHLPCCSGDFDTFKSNFLKNLKLS